MKTKMKKSNHTFVEIKPYSSDNEMIIAEFLPHKKIIFNFQHTNRAKQYAEALDALEDEFIEMIKGLREARKKIEHDMYCDEVVKVKHLTRI